MNNNDYRKIFENKSLDKHYNISEKKLKIHSSNNNINLNNNNNNFVLPEMWICSLCNSVNKSNEYKCLKCKNINIKQKKIIENFIKKSKSEFHQKTERFSTNNNNNNNSNNNINNYSNNNNYGNKINLNSAFKKVSCICYSNYKDNVIKNGICMNCGRKIDKYNKRPSTAKIMRSPLKTNHSKKEITKNRYINNNINNYSENNNNNNNYVYNDNNNNKYKRKELNNLIKSPSYFTNNNNRNINYDLNNNSHINNNINNIIISKRSNNNIYNTKSYKLK
jgi:DNA-directed RNA polymerase subunit RPC12/RpoP